MAWYNYTQQTGTSEWVPVGAKDLPELLESHKPEFNTVLELDRIVMDTFEKDDFASIRYRGPFYVDFDGETLEEVIPQFQKFLELLVEKGVDLESLELAATGGRGFHILVPAKVFVKNPSTSGYPNLPLIYREMAYGMYVDTLDLRVYSTRKGRMWRTFNVQRPNGRYKVQITMTEALNMTVQAYEDLTSAPRQRFPVADPEFAPLLAADFAASKDRVDQAIKKRAKHKSGGMERFKGEAPGSIKAILNGEGIKEGVGFQQIATQLAIVAHALGWDEDRLIQEAEGLCQTHQSDGSRYGSPSKRRQELRRMHQYMDGNPCYTYGVGAIAVLQAEGHSVADLRDRVGPEIEEEGELDESELDPLCEGLIVRRSAIWRKVKDKDTGEWEAQQVCDFGLSGVVQLFDREDGLPVGFDVLVHAKGGSGRQTRILNNDFETKLALRRALGSFGHMKLTDTHVGGLQTVLARMAEKSNSRVITVQTEGINVIVRPVDLPDPTGQSRYFTWYMHTDGCWFYPQEGEESPGRYKLEPFVATNHGKGRSDIQDAPIMENTDESRRLVRLWLNSYPRHVVGRVVGWYCAAFMAPLFRTLFQQFPHLQCYGTAGGGKSSMNVITSRLHTYQQPIQQIAAPHVTDFAMASPLACSSSIPVVYDEVKPREMTMSRWNHLLALIRNNYNGNAGAKGGLNKSSGRSSLVVNETPNVAPMVLMCEARIDQEAVMHRAVLVDFPHAYKGKADDADFLWLKMNAHQLGTLGRALMASIMRIKPEEFLPKFEAVRGQVRERINGRVTDRTTFNTTTVVMGLKALRHTLGLIFKREFDETIDGLIEEVMNDPARHMPVSMSEAARVLDQLAAMSARPMSDPYHLEYGQDWEYDSPDKQHVNINVRSCWDKYLRQCRSQGLTPLFDAEGSYLDSLLRHPAMTDGQCRHSRLRKGRLQNRILQFSLDGLSEEGCEEFAPIPGLTAPPP